VFVAFCVVGFVATVFFVSLASHVGEAAVILMGQG
jgi:hypothetical protein